jgi:hypothetical protein
LQYSLPIRFSSTSTPFSFPAAVHPVYFKFKSVCNLTASISPHFTSLPSPLSLPCQATAPLSLPHQKSKPPFPSAITCKQNHLQCQFWPISLCLYTISVTFHLNPLIHQITTETAAHIKNPQPSPKSPSPFQVNILTVPAISQSHKLNLQFCNHRTQNRAPIFSNLQFIQNHHGSP